MSKKTRKLDLTHLEELHTSGAGYDILRYVGLPELLGDERDTILYYMGKTLARKFDIQTMDDIVQLYEKLGWGKLEMVKQKKKSYEFHLLSDSVVLRLKGPFDADFRLEAGFLAEAVQTVSDVECECVEKINQRIHQIEFSVLFTEVHTKSSTLEV